MISLKQVSINKYKCIETLQKFEIDDSITILVGKNESGKTAILESIAKTNYFTDDESFKFNATHDYPRKEKKKYDKSGQIATVVMCKYEISKELYDEISKDVGIDVLKCRHFEYSKKYDNEGLFNGITTDRDKFFNLQFKANGIVEKELKEKFKSIKKPSDLQEILANSKENNVQELGAKLEPFLKNEWEWDNPIEEYITRVWINPRLPKFLYYSEYYSLPSRIYLDDIKRGNFDDQGEAKTSKALFELADINLDELMGATDFESYIAELEATANEITQQLFKFWKTSKSLRIQFQIEKKIEASITKHILDIRVYDQKHAISLPLRSRSKGFNWFFSFIVWFSQIQEDSTHDYILLLDEPGLNLHASAQEDLLCFIEHLSEKYQIIYTTHSPFMIETEHLDRVLTVLDTNEGTRISNSIQERDPDTLFPLQAALGYDIAQNLFIAKNNLLVEGVSDMLYLTILSQILDDSGGERLREGVTIVPVGGLDKVVTFISLLKGSKLNVICLLDTFTDSRGKQRVEDLIKQKIIKDRNIRFADEFVNLEGGKADIEDIFTKEDYLKIFNMAYPTLKDVEVTDLENPNGKIIPQLCKILKKERYNHYRPARELAKSGVGADFFTKETLAAFSSVFSEINKLIS